VWPIRWPRFSLHTLEDGLNWFLQTTYWAVLQFLKHKLTSHASAAAYYFLLSIAPLILVLVSILNTSLVNYPQLTSELFTFLQQFNPELNEDFFKKLGVLQDAQTAISGLGLLGFLWTSRLIISSMQSAFGVIFPSDRTRNFVWSNLLSLFLVPGVLVLLLLSLLVNVIVRFLYSQVESFVWLEKIYSLLLSLSGLVVPLVLVYGLIFVCYRFLPLARPKTWHAALGAGLCTAAVLGLKTAFVHFVNLAVYNYVYGSLGVVIFLLLWVYLVFALFFFFAQFVQVAGRVDILALDRIIAPQNNSSRIGQRLEARLFGDSRRIFAKFAEHVPAGEVIYRRGEHSQDIYYLQQGSAEIITDDPTGKPRGSAVIEPGSFFGETAYLLDQTRISTVRAKTDAQLLRIKPAIFENLLAQSPEVARKIIDSLGSRLKQVTQQIAC